MISLIILALGLFLLVFLFQVFVEVLNMLGCLGIILIAILIGVYVCL